MNKIKEMLKNKKNNKEVKKLYKEEKTQEKEYRKTGKNYNSSILKYKDNWKQNNLLSEQYVDVPFDSNSNKNQQNSSEETLVLSLESNEIRKIKKKNNKKRKKDEHFNKENEPGYAIEVKNLNKYYLASHNQATMVLKNLNLKIKEGDFVVLFGKSGSGKSTLLNIISGLDRPTEGQVIVKNNNLPYLSNSQLTKFRRDYISFIFQQYHLLNNITGYENVETGAILQKNKENKLDIEQMFKDFELEDVIYKYPSQMSGGQQQRVSILRAIAKNTDLIFADEPTGALDKKTSDIVMELLKKINEEQGKTIIMVSHDPDIVKYAKRKIFLQKGKIISDERIR